MPTEVNKLIGGTDQMKKVKICADSTCDLTPELLEKYNIDVFALPVNLGDKPCLDGVDVHPEDLYQYYRSTGKLTTTAAPSPVECREFYRKYAEEGLAVIHFSISSEMTITHANHRLGAEEFEDIYPVDSYSLSSGMGRLALEAAALAQQGYDVPTILQKVEEMKSHIEVSFILDTLEFLWKGGRCSGLSALGANMLRLKPCIEVKEGKMVVGKKFRGSLSHVHEEYITQRLKDRTDLRLDKIFITHSGGLDQSVIDAAVKKVRELQHFDEVYVTRAGCSVSNHCGPGTLGLIYMTK